MVNKEYFQKKSLKDILNEDLSPDMAEKYSVSEMADFLVNNHIVSTHVDVNKLLIESIQRAYMEDDEFPIRYYKPNEQMSEDSKVVKVGDCLTDDFIEKHMKG